MRFKLRYKALQLVINYCLFLINIYMQLTTVLKSNTINQDKFTIEKGLEYISDSVWQKIF